MIRSASPTPAPLCLTATTQFRKQALAGGILIFGLVVTYVIELNHPLIWLLHVLGWMQVAVWGYNTRLIKLQQQAYCMIRQLA